MKKMIGGRGGGQKGPAILADAHCMLLHVLYICLKSCIQMFNIIGKLCTNVHHSSCRQVKYSLKNLIGK